MNWTDFLDADSGTISSISLTSKYCVLNAILFVENWYVPLETDKDSVTKTGEIMELLNLFITFKGSANSQDTS